MRESEPEKRRKPLIYIRLTNVQEHLYPHFSVLERGLFLWANRRKQAPFNPFINILYPKRAIFVGAKQFRKNISCKGTKNQ